MRDGWQDISESMTKSAADSQKVIRLSDIEEIIRDCRVPEGMAALIINPGFKVRHILILTHILFLLLSAVEGDYYESDNVMSYGNKRLCNILRQ